MTTTPPELDDRRALICTRLLELAEKAAAISEESEGLKAELRDLPGREYALPNGHSLKLTPTRRFDPVKALGLVSVDDRPSCYVLTLDEAKVKSLITPAALEDCMVEHGKAKVVIR